MADVLPEEDRRRQEEEWRAREQEEAMDRLLLEQEQQQLLEEDQDGDDLAQLQQRRQPAPFADDPAIDEGDPDDNANDTPALTPRAGITYTQGSFLAAACLIFYALRTRHQWYLALVFLTSSKLAYILLGNAIIAACVATFRITVRFFIKGMRPTEAEGLGDFFRWNVTETCLALTMFRSEMNVKTGILFLILVLSKCVHFVAETRRSHLNMTEEAVIPTTHGFWKGWPSLQPNFMRISSLLHVLMVVDMFAIALNAHDIADNGPSVAMFFGFEYSILFVSAMNNILLTYLHLFDGLIHWSHEHSAPGSFWHKRAHAALHAWKDHKATLNFAVEVHAQFARFLFYISFFGIVMTYYGIPVNLFREVYMSFQNLRTRLTAFAKYRTLMRSMNRFESVQSEEELEEAGRTCIICRDAMTLVDCKKLPGCGHVFHKSCLREWLVQQQTCPTCRGDIAAMQARVRTAEARELATDAGTGSATAAELTSPEQQQQEEQALAVKLEADLSQAQARTAAGHNIHEVCASLANDAVDSIIKPDTFPCLYRVNEDEGAVVWNTINGAAQTLRIIPRGTIVLCTKLECTSFEDSFCGMVLKIPDGWIRETSLEHLSFKLPIQKPKASTSDL